jgi:hypothetical protein
MIPSASLAVAGFGALFVAGILVDLRDNLLVWCICIGMSGSVWLLVYALLREVFQ